MLIVFLVAFSSVGCGEGGESRLLEAGWTLRGYEPGDLEALYRLDLRCFAVPFRFSRAVMRAAAEAPNAVSVLAWGPAEGDEERLLGFALGSLEVVDGERVGYVATLDVDPAYRRRGLGLVLLREVEALLAERGAGWVALHVFAENDAAQRLYAAAGYQRGERVARFYGRAGDAWVYRKALGGASRAS